MTDTHADEFPAPPAAEIVELTPMDVDRDETQDDTVVAVEVVEQLATEPAPPCHVMLDLETWGTGNKAAIISIGACKFDENEIIDSFHVGVDPVSCQTFGLEIDADTLLWWMDPERDEARREWLKLERIDLPSALLGFELWCKSSPEVIAIWGNGSTFDNVITRSAYEATGQTYPISFRQDRCYRTMRDLTDTPMVREGTHHNALSDAISQAKHLQAIWRKLDPTRYINQLREDQEQFGFYAAQHRAKLDELGEDSTLREATTRKAVVNETLEQKIKQLLDGGPVEA
jgi:hypothetical protein